MEYKKAGWQKENRDTEREAKQTSKIGKRISQVY